MSPIETIDEKPITGWRHGKLIFDAMPLSDAIQEIARYRSVDIRIADPSLADIKVSGVFSSKDLDAFFQALEHIIPVKIRHINTRLIIVERDDSA